MLTWVVDRGDELLQWLAALDRPFAFLLAIPFAVALAGLAAELARHRRAKVPNRLNGKPR